MSATWRVELTREAFKQLRKLPKKIQRQVAHRIDGLAINPKPPQSRRLKNTSDLHRLRSGDYRIIYRRTEEPPRVLVVRIGHRKDVYRGH